MYKSPFGGQQWQQQRWLLLQNWSLNRKFLFRYSPNPKSWTWASTAAVARPTRIGGSSARDPFTGTSSVVAFSRSMASSSGGRSSANRWPSPTRFGGSDDGR